MKNIGLVLEGGGMRGIYTAGVLDFFLEKNLHFNYVIGVSAGACNAASYISKQKERNKIVNSKFINDWRYLSFRNLIKSKSIFGTDFIFDEIPNKLLPFDYKTFENSPSNFIIGTTDCTTGKPVYFHKNLMKKDNDLLRATSALPLVAPIVNIENYRLLDGGIADPIPIKKSIKDGNDKNIVVLTRNKGYIKEPDKMYSFYKIKYRKYPKLVDTMINRHNLYNETLKFIEELEKRGECIVIRPTKPLKVGRYEKDAKKLLELYENAIEDTKDKYQDIINMLK